MRGVLPRAAGTDVASIGAVRQRASVRHSCGFYLQMGLKKPVCVCRGAGCAGDAAAVLVKFLVRIKFLEVLFRKPVA